MSDRIPPGRQGRWQDPRRGSRGPGRTARATLLPPGIVPAETTELLAVEPEPDPEEDDEMTPQKDPSGGSGGIGGPKAPPAGPKTPPPPPPPPSE